MSEVFYLVKFYDWCQEMEIKMLFKSEDTARYYMAEIKKDECNGEPSLEELTLYA